MFCEFRERADDVFFLVNAGDVSRVVKDEGGLAVLVLMSGQHIPLVETYMQVRAVLYDLSVD